MSSVLYYINTCVHDDSNPEHHLKHYMMFNSQTLHDVQHLLYITDLQNVV